MFRNFRLVLHNSRLKVSTNPHRVTGDITDPLPSANITTKILKVAVIGVPNAGKSTFINNLMDRKVCPASRKVHTTRARSMAVFTEGDSQIVFLDTPGLVNFMEHKKFNLERSFLKDCKSSLKEADLIGVIHDVSNIHTRERLDIKVINLLEDNMEKPSFLVLNKVDLLKSKRKLLDITRIVTNSHISGKPIPNSKPLAPTESDNKSWPHFQEIFMVSALTGSGLPEIKKHLSATAKMGNWMFPAEVWSDRTAEQVIVDSVKAKLLDFLPQEIPYQLRPELELFDIGENGVITTVVLVHCPNERVAKLVAGVAEGKLRQINESLQHDLQDAFQNYVRVKIVLQTPKVG